MALYDILPHSEQVHYNRNVGGQLFHRALGVSAIAVMVTRRRLFNPLIDHRPLQMVSFLKQQLSAQHIKKDAPSMIEHTLATVAMQVTFDKEQNLARYLYYVRNPVP